MLIFGTRGYADISHDFFCLDSDRDMVVLAVDDEYLKGSSHNGLPVVPSEELELAPTLFDLFVAIGLGDNNQLGARKVTELQAHGYELATIAGS